jgi:hypothetical protein
MGSIFAPQCGHLISLTIVETPFIDAAAPNRSEDSIPIASVETFLFNPASGQNCHCLRLLHKAVSVIPAKAGIQVFVDFPDPVPRSARDSPG